MRQGNRPPLTVGGWQNCRGLRNDLQLVIGWSGATLWNYHLIPNGMHYTLRREVEKQESKKLRTKECTINRLTNQGFD
jgi:hypothetical protein